MIIMHNDKFTFIHITLEQGAEAETRLQGSNHSCNEKQFRQVGE
jgi:hypothetical protein